MTREKIIELVNSIFIEQFELSQEELTPDKKIFEDLGLDSLDIVDLITGLQRKFKIPLRQNEQIRQIRTLDDIYTLFEKLALENPDIAEKIIN
ncbi:MAG: phosphopantetheine-binding protein [Victivallaceae bacterium]|jgi:acyl carrier protein|nr:phosphopantetheine-binding protein [Victivallaceae bacterium]NLK82726.1 acyl carrier protein [Lentisphaerota bacterium]MDD3116345.1 phosphopantetheine-binding protein [Victivallaceae bacterium]MDD3704163.1 phosphopantetheine-binding protein [Victivallaceae bacterium]MDD4317302.1 phosphopantetheine-binding protein [Victivallaceae bacterium]